MKILLVFALIACVAEAQLAGGLIDVDPQREDVLAAANFAYTLGVNSINSAYTHRLVKVVKAQSQVVAGTKYYLTLEIGETDCLQHNQIDETSCKVTKSEVCEAVVLVREWLESGQKELLSFNCKLK